MPALYSRVFLQILDSSIAEDWQVRHIFEDLLKLADRFGVIDMTHAAIARRLNIPLEIVRTAITKLESPDPNSRNPEHDGRRIERLSETRDWGWRIINWAEYDAIRDRAAANERLIRHREKKKLAAVTEGNGVTPGNEEVSVAAPDENKKTKFIPPTQEEVLFQCQKVGLPEIEGRKFFAHYDEQEWKPKNGPVKDWRKRLTKWKLTWESNGRPMAPSTRPKPIAV